MKLYNMVELHDFYITIKDSKMPIKTAYKFAMLMQKTEKEIEFYGSEFQKILDEYAKKENGEFVLIENGAAIAIQEGKEAECNQKIQELRDIEVDTGDITFSLDELDCLQLTFEQLNKLLPLIKD